MSHLDARLGRGYSAGGYCRDPAGRQNDTEAIAQELEKRGVRTAAGRPTWAPAQVARLMA